VEREAGLIAAERVLAEPDKGVGLHLSDRPARHVGVGGVVPLRFTGGIPSGKSNHFGIG